MCERSTMDQWRGWLSAWVTDIIMYMNECGDKAKLFRHVFVAQGSCPLSSQARMFPNKSSKLGDPVSVANSAVLSTTAQSIPSERLSAAVRAPSMSPSREQLLAQRGPLPKTASNVSGEVT